MIFTCLKTCVCVGYGRICSFLFRMGICFVFIFCRTMPPIQLSSQGLPFGVDLGIQLLKNGCLNVADGYLLIAM